MSYFILQKKKTVFSRVIHSFHCLFIRVTVNYDRQMNMISYTKTLTRFKSSSSASHDSAVKFCCRRFNTGRLLFEFKSNVSKCFIIESIGTTL